MELNTNTEDGENAIINSLPKSGTNLLSDLFNLLGYHKSAHIGSSLRGSNKFLSRIDRLIRSPLQQGILVGIDTPTETNPREIERCLRICNHKKKSFVTAHTGYTDTILKICLQHNLKPFVVIRDPRAVLNSFVHYVSKNRNHYLHKFFIEKNQMERYRMGLNGFNYKNVQLPSLYSRCVAVYPWLNSPQVLEVKFENLIGEKGGGSNNFQMDEIDKICRHLSIEISLEEKQNIAAKLFGKNDNTFRKGQSYSWEREMPSIIIEEANIALKPILDNWNY